MVLIETVVLAVAVTVLKITFKVLLSTLASHYVKEFLKKEKFDEEVVKNLTFSLLAIDGVLNDAEQKQISNVFVKQWLDEVKHVIYRAEDALDEINTLVKQHNSTRRETDKEAESLQYGKISKNLKLEFKVIADHLTLITSQINLLGLKQGIAIEAPQTLPTTSLEDKSMVYGRYVDRDKIIASLLSANIASERNIPLIAVVGVGGVGKTTLSQMIYNDSRVCNHFDRKLWVHVSEELNILKITKVFYESLTRKECNINDLNVLQVELALMLARKRVLLVLDDVWTENFVYWELLFKPLKVAPNGSRIIITSRNENVASAMGAYKTHRGTNSHKRIPEIARHFSYKREEFDSAEKFDTLSEAKYLRTFLPVTLSNSNQSFLLGTSVLKNTLPSLRYLRVLSFSHFKDVIDINLDDKYFSQMKHLRYLDFSYTRIEKLPVSVTSLHDLQTLLVSNSSLLLLPADISKLLNLRHLDVSATKLKGMPVGFSGLKCLKFLTTFVVSNGSDSTANISELGKIQELHGKLIISELQNIREASDAASANLKDKKYLKEAIFKWEINRLNGLPSEDSVLASLKPHENIEKVTIENFVGENLPAWLGDASLSSMVSLRLINCRLCLSLPSVGQLPSLQELYIKDCPRLIGRLPNHLPSLKTLYIHNCRELNFLDDITEHEFPVIQRLFIHKSCNTLASFPLGLFIKLEELQIVDCRGLRDIRIVEEPRDGIASLQRLLIKDCHSLEQFCERWLPRPTPNLISFSLSYCPKLRSIPDQLHMPLTPSWKICGCPLLQLPIANGMHQN
ncbi:hypothetical protein ACFE04_006330 [Oxalis oulophora]